MGAVSALDFRPRLAPSVRVAGKGAVVLLGLTAGTLTAGVTPFLSATLATGFAAGFVVASDPRFATGLAGDFTAGFAATFAVTFVVGFATGFGTDLAAGFGATFVTGFAAAFGTTLVDATFAGAAFTGVPVVTLLTCFAFVTCSPPLPL